MSNEVNTPHKFQGNPVLVTNAADMQAAGRAALGVGLAADAQTIFYRSQVELNALHAQHRVGASDSGGKVSTTFQTNAINADGVVTPARFTVSQGRDPSQSLGDFHQQRLNEQREELLNLELGTYGMSTKRDIDKITRQLEDISHYDREGQPVHVIKGRARLNLTRELDVLQRNHQLEVRTAALAGALQAEVAQAKQKALDEDTAAAMQMAETEAREDRVKRIAQGYKSSAAKHFA